MKDTIATAILPLLEQRKDSKAALVQQKEGNTYRSLSWKAYHQKILSLSAYLQKQGISSSGEKVLLCSENCPEWGIAFLASLNLGASVVPVPFSSTAKEIKNILEKTQAKFLFLSENIKKSLGEETKLPANFAWNIEKEDPLKEIIQDESPISLNPYNCDSESIAVLIYTSGTTGSSKAVPLTHKNILSNIKDIVKVLELNHKDTSVSILPLSHMLELTGGFLTAIYQSVRIVYTKSLRTEDILNAMQRWKCSIFLTVPLVLELIAKGIEKQLNELPKVIKPIFSFCLYWTKLQPSMGKFLLYPIHKKFGGNLRFFISGGAKLQAWVYEFFTNIGIPVLQGYGLTETSPVISITSLKDKNPKTVGKVLANLKLAIFNEEGQISTGEGEICVKGDSVFRGYLQEEYNKDVFFASWFRTGDLGIIHSDSSLEVTGRKKDIIVTAGGKNVYPEEIEAALMKTGKFLEACILGLTSELGHEKIAAILRPNKASCGFHAEDDASILRKVRAIVAKTCKDMSEYMKPQEIHILEEEFPKTHTKKIKRHELKKTLNKKKKVEKVNTNEKINMEDKLERVVAESIEHLSKKPALSLSKGDSLLNDIGLDSLTLVEVISSVEKEFSCDTDSIELGSLETLNDLLQELKKSSQNTVVKKASVCFSNFHPTDGLKFYWFIPRMIIAIFLRVFLKIFIRISAGGSRNYRKERGPLVFTPNHKSHLDTIAVVSTMNYTRQRKTFAVAAKDYFFEQAWKALFARIFINAIPFDRKKKVKEGLKKCSTILEEGGSLVIFPEGSRVTKKEMTPFKHGVGHLLAANNKVKAVPVYISGTQHAFPPGAAVLRPRKVSVFYGEPISFSGYSTEDAPKEIAEKLQKEVLKLQEKYEARQQYR